MKIAVIQPGCYGDNINSTLMFEPLKSHYQGCTIDVFTADRYAKAFACNPFINEIKEYPSHNKDSALNLMNVIQPVGYDLVINSHPMRNRTWSSSKHPGLGENLILAWVNTLESHGIEYTVPLQTDLVLSPYEVNKATTFINNLPKERKGLWLMECEGESGQSFWNPQWTQDAIMTLTNLGYIVLVSCVQQKELIQKLQVQTMNRCIWVGSVDLRTVTGMYDHCDGFISVSSGLSNCCNTRQRKHVPNWVEVVNSLTCSSNVVRSDAKKTFWHDNDVNKFCAHLRDTY